MKKPTRFEKLGFGHGLKLSWLDLSLRLALNNESAKSARETLTSFIGRESTASGERGESQLKKCVSLLSAWHNPDKELCLFRDQLLLQAKETSSLQWPILHWAMLSAQYPFLLRLTLVLGRLFSLQGQVEKSQILSRLEQNYGAMPPVERNMRYALSTLSNLGFLDMTGRNGLYFPPKERMSTDFELTAILWKTILHATKGGCVSLTTIRNSPAFYPFALTNIQLGEFVANFSDVDYHPYAGIDEQVYLKS